MDEATRDALTQYIRELFASDDEHLQTIREESANAGLPQIHIRPEEGRILQMLLLIANARRVAEVGTLAGYSATWMARALPEGGRLITLEKDPDRAEIARKLFAHAGIGERVEVRVGAAPEGLALLAEDAPYDAVFIDADKTGYPDTLEWAVAHVRHGGLVMAHNAFRRGAVVDRDSTDASVRGIREFNRRIAEDPRLEGTIIPAGDGIAVAVRVR